MSYESSHSPPARGPYRRPVVVVAGGSAPDPDVTSVLPADPFVIAADSGFVHAGALGLRVDVLVGDFDSLSSEALLVAERSETDVLRFPADKDATDLELALDLAIRRDPEELVVVAGGEGERIDHFITVVALLSDPRYGSARVSAWLGRSRLVVTRPGQPAALVCPGGAFSFVSLAPVTAQVHGVTTSGLKFALHRETLERHRTRGVSNVFVSPSASVSVEVGTLLVIQPNALPAHQPKNQVSRR
jgi:thiamine pyrophosphokinase